jgi:hypothetical protein
LTLSAPDSRCPLILASPPASPLANKICDLRSRVPPSLVVSVLLEAPAGLPRSPPAGLAPLDEPVRREMRPLSRAISADDGGLGGAAEAGKYFCLSESQRMPLKAPRGP